MRGAPPAVPVALPPKSTNPTSTKCTVRSPCPIAPAAQPRANPRPTTSPKAPAARFSSQPTRANPAPNSAPPRAPLAARPGTGVGGRSDRSRCQTSASSAIPSVKSKSRCWDPPACCSAPSPAPAHCCGNATASPAPCSAPSLARHGIQVNGHLSWRISSRNFGSQPAHFRRVLTLPLALLARTRPRAKRLTTAMFLAPWPVR